MGFKRGHIDHGNGDDNGGGGIITLRVHLDRILRSKFSIMERSNWERTRIARWGVSCSLWIISSRASANVRPSVLLRYNS